MLWIMNVDDGSAIGRIDMADVGVPFSTVTSPPPGKSVLPTCLMFLLMPTQANFLGLIVFLPV